MQYDVQVEDRDGIPIASVRKEINQSGIGAWVSEAAMVIFPTLGAAGLRPIGPMHCRYHTWADNRTDCKVGIPISGSAPAGLTDSEIPAGRSASTVHIGPHETIPAAYEALPSWMENAGVAPGPGPYEVYLTDRATTSPDQLRTEVVWPLG